MSIINSSVIVIIKSILSYGNLKRIKTTCQGMKRALEIMIRKVERLPTNEDHNNGKNFNNIIYHQASHHSNSMHFLIIALLSAISIKNILGKKIMIKLTKSITIMRGREDRERQRQRQIETIIKSMLKHERINKRSLSKKLRL
jgi:hypothetical protein